MAALTVPSSTRTPVSRASCSCARSTIMRSRTWRSSTSRGGGWIFCRRSCDSDSVARVRSSLAVITSSLTTATMRSSGRDVRGPLGGSGAGAGRAAALPAGCGGCTRGLCASARPLSATSATRIECATVRERTAGMRGVTRSSRSDPAGAAAGSASGSRGYYAAIVSWRSFRHSSDRSVPVGHRRWSWPGPLSSRSAAPRTGESSSRPCIRSRPEHRPRGCPGWSS